MGAEANRNDRDRLNARNHYAASVLGPPRQFAACRVVMPQATIPARKRTKETAVPKLNAYYLNLRASYLFAEIKQRTQTFTNAHSGARLINLGIGDVTQPLPPTVVRALHEATDEM